MIVGASRVSTGVGTVGTGETEVEDLHGSVTSQFDIGRLQVAMDDALFVGALHGVGDLPRDRQCFVKVERAARDAFGERQTLDEFEDEPFAPGDVFDAVDRGDMPVIERGENPRLTLEPLRCGRGPARTTIGRILMATSRCSRGSRAR